MSDSLWYLQFCRWCRSHYQHHWRRCHLRFSWASLRLDDVWSSARTASFRGLEQNKNKKPFINFSNICGKSKGEVGEELGKHKAFINSECWYPNCQLRLLRNSINRQFLFVSLLTYLYRMACYLKRRDLDNTNIKKNKLLTKESWKLMNSSGDIHKVVFFLISFEVGSTFKKGKKKITYLWSSYFEFYECWSSPWIETLSYVLWGPY